MAKSLKLPKEGVRYSGGIIELHFVYDDIFKGIDKVYIDGPCGSKTVAGVLFKRLKRVGHVTNFLKTRYQCVILYKYSWALELPY